MKQILRLVMVAGTATAIVSSGGCGGGLTQKEMMRNAIRRTPAEEEEPDDVPLARQQTPPGKTDTPSADVPGSTAATPASAAGDVSQPSGPSSSNGGPGPAISGASGFEVYRGPEPVSPDTSQPLSPEQSRKQAIAKMQRLAEALEAYCKDKGHYPPPAIYGARRESLLSWRVALLPYLGHSQLHQQFELGEPWDSKHNHSLLAQIPPVFVSPEGELGRTNFLLPVGAGTAFAGRTGAVPKSIEDGAENTVILLEIDNAHAVPWTAPEDYQVNLREPTLGLGTLRGGGFLAVWGGGTINWIDITTPQRLLQTIYTTDSGDGVTAAQVGHEPLADLAPIDPNTPLADDPPADTPTAAESDTATTDVARNRTGSASNEHPLPQPGTPDAGGPAVGRRHPVPNEDVLAESKELLRELYQEDYKAAATPSARQSLVKRMLDQLHQLDADFAGQYALLDTVRQISQQTGIVETALAAVDELSSRFEIDGPATKLETLIGLTRSADGQESQKITQASIQACREAFLAEHYDVAEQLCGMALAAAQKQRNAALTTKLQRLRQEVQAAAKSHRLAERAMSTLEENADDQRAAVMLGKYLCLVRQDWPNGLPILARGDDPQFRQLAEGELAQPSQAAAQIGLGDAWWREAEKAEAGERRSMLSRAVYWYRMGTPNLPPGLARVKIEHRLRQSEKSLAEDADDGSGSGSEPD